MGEAMKLQLKGSCQSGEDVIRSYPKDDCSVPFLRFHDLRLSASSTYTETFDGIVGGKSHDPTRGRAVVGVQAGRPETLDAWSRGRQKR